MKRFITNPIHLLAFCCAVLMASTWINAARANRAEREAAFYIDLCDRLSRTNTLLYRGCGPDLRIRHERLLYPPPRD